MATRRKRKTKRRTSAPRKPAPNPILVKLEPEIKSSVTRVLKRFSKGGRHSLTALPDQTQLKVAEFDHEGYTYVLTRIKLLPDETLTGRQREIALRVAQGMSNRKIADDLEISPATVAAHLRTIFTKLRIKSRTALAQHALSFYG